MGSLASIHDLIQHIRALSPEKDAARLSFYQYLIHFNDSTEAVTAQAINKFFLRALQFTHWQVNKTHLFDEVYGILRHFQKAKSTRLNLEGLLQSSDIQAVAVETISNLEHAVARHLEKPILAEVSDPVSIGARSRVIRDGEERVLGIVLFNDQRLRISVYPKVLALKNGDLMPLHDDLALHYTRELTLQKGVMQELDLGAHALARFVLAPDETIHGVIVRGYTFQLVEKLEGGTFEQHPSLFYPLKRLEQFFIDRRTDPVYQDLTATLEKALDLVAHQHPEGERYARWALERSRFAFEHIYSEDKLVRLISNLERRLQAPSAAVTTTAQAHAPVAPRATSNIEESFGVDLVEAAQTAQPRTERKNEQKFPKTREDEKWPEIKNLPV